MLDGFARLLDVSTTVAALVLALIVVQVATQVFALVDLARRDAVRSAPKWLWALVITFGNLVGAIAYLVVGRKPPDEVDLPGAGGTEAGSEAARRAVDALYGPRDRR